MLGRTIKFAGLGALLALGVAAVAARGPAVASPELSAKQELGKSIFFDMSLSINQNLSCASCHGPSAGWTGPIAAINEHGSVYEGSIAGRFGDRKPPSSAYATLSPVLHVDRKGLFIGGNFWDGRATGEKLGNPAADQAQGPFLNPKEQALPDSACVVYRVCTGAYASAFEEVWGEAACEIGWPADVETVCATEGATVVLSSADMTRSEIAYDQIGLSIAAYEASPQVNAFSSKHDATFMGAAKLSKVEQHGYAIFRGKGGCAACHPANGQAALFTDFTYDNLGLPQNPENPAGVAPAFVDAGLGGFLKSSGYPEDVYAEEWGKVKVPTLRNVGLGSCEAEPTNPDCIVKAYGHNGYFKTLAGIVHFYNTRDVLDTCPGPYTEAEALAANCWPAPEVSGTVNHDELGDLGLTPQEEEALVEFLLSLSDGYLP